jgi:hypothetical protein
MSASGSEDLGAHSLTATRKRNRRWLPWLALIVVLALAALAVLLLTNANDKNDKPGIDIRDDASQAGVPTLDDGPAVLAFA